MLTIYLVISIGAFLYGLYTALEDAQIVRSQGETPELPSAAEVFFLLLVSFIPGINLLLIGMTFLYRTGKL